jgi:uncharacterized membrane protein
MLKEHVANQTKDQQTYIWAALTLRWGMYISFGAMVAGLVWWVLAGAPGGESSAAKVIPLDRILPELVALNPLALINLGVVLLLATPGVTLFTIIVTYAAARNWRYVGIAMSVAAILLLSLAISLKWIVLF